MSKHKTSEEKLHVSRHVQIARQPRPAKNSQNQLSPAPAKRTNANNQYR